MIVLTILLAGTASCAREETPGSAASSVPPQEAAAPPSAGGPSASAAQGRPASKPSVTAIVTDILLSPAAMVQAEKFMCVCGCGMVLAECTCEKEPGGISMKRHLQALVDQGLSPAAIADDMVATYGSAVLP